MTETSARWLDWNDPRLAPLREEDLPAFLVDLTSFTVVAASASGMRLGAIPGAPLPSQAAPVVRALAVGSARAPALVRLRLPRSLMPRLFRFQHIDLNGTPALLFTDPTALRELPVRSAQTRPEGQVRPAIGFDILSPTVRFTFELDANGCIRAFSPTLAQALKSSAASWIGATFADLEARGQIVSGAAALRALAQGSSFSGVHLTVPGTVILDLEVGGVPLLDAARRRVGIRGFGILRRWLASSAPAIEVPDTTEFAAPSLAPPSWPETPPVAPPVTRLTPHEIALFHEIGSTLADAEERPLPPLTDSGDDAPESDLPHAGAILDALPLAALLERNEELTHANRAFLQWTGWPDEEAIRRAGGVAGVLRGAPDGELLSAAGEHMPVTVHTAAPFLVDDARLHVLEPRENAAAVRSSELEEERQAALDLVPWPVLLLDEARRIRFANHAAAIRFGFTAAELEGQPVTIAIAPEARGETMEWLDRATAGNDETVPPQVLNLRAHGDRPFRALAGLAPAGNAGGHICLVLGPEPASDADEYPDPARLEPAPLPPPVPDHTAEAPGIAPPEPAPDPSTALHRVARRLAESLNPSLATLVGYAPPEDATWPEPVRVALATVQQGLGDLAALADPLVDAEGVPTALAPVIAEAVAVVQPSARRRHVIIRTDIEAMPPVIARPERLARLVRQMLEEALAAAPAGTAVTVSLSGAQPSGTAACLMVSDAGPPVDEVDAAAAADPLAPSAGQDRFSRGGRPLRLARLDAEARAVGAVFTLRRGTAGGMTAELAFPSA